jgi:autoinducer 2-degrading protein
MFVVTVTFKIDLAHVASFRDAMFRQAQNSLQLEEGCQQFDVCFDPTSPGLCFLYEKYDDRNAFDGHLGSDHFKSFDATVAPWLVSKEVQTWTEESGS